MNIFCQAHIAHDAFMHMRAYDALLAQNAKHIMLVCMFLCSYRQLHEERQNLIRQWEEAMDAMRHRDAAIAAATDQFAEQKRLLRERQRELDAQARFLDNETANTKEADARIAYYDRELVS